MPAISQKKRIKFVYADSTFSRTLNNVGGYSAYYVFRGNSPFDPDYTGFGVQPYGWDDYMGDRKFGNFYCHASAIKVYFHPETAFASMRRLHVNVFPCRQYNPTLSDISDVRMIPQRKGTCYDGVTEGTKGCIVSNYSSIRRLYGFRSDDLACEGSYAANPSSTASWYWIVHFYTDAYIDEEIDIFFDVKIKYYTVITRYNQPDES